MYEKVRYKALKENLLDITTYQNIYYELEINK